MLPPAAPRSSPILPRRAIPRRSAGWSACRGRRPTPLAGRQIASATFRSARGAYGDRPYSPRTLRWLPGSPPRSTAVHTRSAESPVCHHVDDRISPGRRGGPCSSCWSRRTAPTCRRANAAWPASSRCEFAVRRASPAGHRFPARPPRPGSAQSPGWYLPFDPVSPDRRRASTGEL
jgi:hypothetical protein